MPLTPPTIQTFCLGPWMTNCYVVHAPPAGLQNAGSECWIIDASFEPGPLIDYVQQNKLTPVAVLLTHAHVDHIAGLHDIRRVWPEVPILIHDAEREFLTDAMLNLSAVAGEPVVAPEATGSLQHGQQLTLGGATFEVRHTPGHSPGGVAIIDHSHGVALVGDTLFADSIGRSDFPTSDGEALLRSIRTQLLTLPDATRIHPGHGPATTIGRERKENPFLR